jgi:hypothetical protein
MENLMRILLKKISKEFPRGFDQPLLKLSVTSFFSNPRRISMRFSKENFNMIMPRFLKEFF